MNTFLLATELNKFGKHSQTYVVQYSQNEMAELFTKEQLKSLDSVGYFWKGQTKFVDMVKAAQRVG